MTDTSTDISTDTRLDQPTAQKSENGRPVLTIVGVTLIVALPLIVAAIVLAQRRWFPVLDLAMTEFRIRDVGGRYTPLIGLPGRIGTFPDQGSHPGPLSFWLVAPGYRLFGSSAWAMEAGTVMVQMAWIGVALWIGHRRAGTAGVVVVAAVLAVLLRGYGLTVLVQPWNPYLPLFAWVVILLATWSVLCGDHMMLIPLVVGASFAAQTHIPYLTMAGALGLFAIGVVVVRCWRSDDRRSFRTPLAWTGGLFVVLWLGPLADQIRRDPGNVRRLLEHFTSPDEVAIGFRQAGNVMFRHLDVLDGYARLLTGTQRFLQVGYEPTGRIWPGVLMFVDLGRRVRGGRADAAPPPRRTAHDDRRDAGADPRVDVEDLRQDLVLPHAVGVGNHDPDDRRRRLDGHRVAVDPTPGDPDPPGRADRRGSGVDPGDGVDGDHRPGDRPPRRAPR